MTNKILYETLDPADWKEMRALAHRMVMMPSRIWKRSANARCGSQYRRM